MIIVNTESVQGHQIAQVLGLVRGTSVRARNIARDIGQLFKSIVGGELKDYGKMLNDARDQAIARMIVEAEKLGANAIVNVRFATSSVMGGAAEILVYGTAVRVR